MTRVKTLHEFDDTSTEVIQEVSENGWVKLVKVDVPNFTNSITVTVTVKDTDGYAVWTKATIAKNAVTSYGNGPDGVSDGEFPIDYRYTVTATLSGAAGGTGGTVKVMMYAETE